MRLTQVFSLCYSKVKKEKEKDNQYKFKRPVAIAISLNIRDRAFLKYFTYVSSKRLALF